MKYLTTALSRSILFALALVTASLPAQKAAPAPQSLPGAKTEIYKTIGEIQLPIHVFSPKNHDPGMARPAIIFFFGGGWRNGSPQQFLHHCEYLASRGMVAMTAEYRVASRHGVKARSCFEDAKSAIRWARKNASRLGIDPNRLAAGGGSAGGHLAGALATISDFNDPNDDLTFSSIPNALVLYNPALVLAPIPGAIPFDDERAKDLQERMGVSPAALSPYHNLNSNLPPTIIFHGKADTTVAFATVEAFANRAKALGNRCQLVGYEGQTHGFFNYGRDDNAMFEATLTETDRFLVSIGFLKGKPHVSAFMKTILQP